MNNRMTINIYQQLNLKIKINEQKQKIDPQIRRTF